MSDEPTTTPPDYAAIGKALMAVLDSLANGRGTLELYASYEAPFGGAVTIHDGSTILDNPHVAPLVDAINRASPSQPEPRRP